MKSILVSRLEGLYCAAGDFYIDPSRAVDKAVVTHAHSDHARRGAKAYLCHKDTAGPLRVRLGKQIQVQSLEYGEQIIIGDARISLHPAGHIIGSAQVRVEVAGNVWVVSGDYKTTSDGLCVPFEPVKCHVFISETTFGLPVYRWPDEDGVLNDIRTWWAYQTSLGRIGVTSVYSLGKAQRILHALLGAESAGQIFVHPIVHEINLSLGSAFPTLNYQLLNPEVRLPSGALVVAPHGFKPDSGSDPAFAQLSGWFRTSKRAGGSDSVTGFCLSDHADWPGLLSGILATDCEQVLLYHGNTHALCRYLNEAGLPAKSLLAIEHRNSEIRDPDVLSE